MRTAASAPNAEGLQQAPPRFVAGGTRRNSNWHTAVCARTSNKADAQRRRPGPRHDLQPAITHHRQAPMRPDHHESDYYTGGRGSTSRSQTEGRHHQAVGGDCRRVTVGGYAHRRRERLVSVRRGSRSDQGSTRLRWCRGALPRGRNGCTRGGRRPSSQWAPIVLIGARHRHPKQTTAHPESAPSGAGPSSTRPQKPDRPRGSPRRDRDRRRTAHGWLLHQIKIRFGRRWRSGAWPPRDSRELGGNGRALSTRSDTCVNCTAP